MIRVESFDVPLFSSDRLHGCLQEYKLRTNVPPLLRLIRTYPSDSHLNPLSIQSISGLRCRIHARKSLVKFEALLTYRPITICFAMSCHAMYFHSSQCSQNPLTCNGLRSRLDDTTRVKFTALHPVNRNPGCMSVWGIDHNFFKF